MFLLGLICINVSLCACNSDVKSSVSLVHCPKQEAMSEDSKDTSFSSSIDALVKVLDSTASTIPTPSDTSQGYHFFPVVIN